MYSEVPLIKPPSGLTKMVLIERNIHVYYLKRCSKQKVDGLKSGKVLLLSGFDSRTLLYVVFQGLFLLCVICRLLYCTYYVS